MQTLVLLAQSISFHPAWLTLLVPALGAVWYLARATGPDRLTALEKAFASGVERIEKAIEGLSSKHDRVEQRTHDLHTRVAILESHSDETEHTGPNGRAP